MYRSALVDRCFRQSTSATKGTVSTCGFKHILLHVLVPLKHRRQFSCNWLLLIHLNTKFQIG